MDAIPHRTTVRLNKDLLRHAKNLAADQGKSVTSLIEEGLRSLLAKGDTLVRIDLDNARFPGLTWRPPF